MMGNKQTALDTLVREELGIDPRRARRLRLDGGGGLVSALLRRGDISGAAVFFS